MPKPVREIPTEVTEIDMATGKETPARGSWRVLPPKPDKCQICAVKHTPQQPHNAQSLYYQMLFHGMVGRMPTWADALAHCPDEVKELWERELRQRGHWSEPPAGEAPVAHHGVGE
jgi:hypothetical protein